MEPDMRRLIAFPCGAAVLAGSLDPGTRPVGILMAPGGSQTRVGSHRMYERLALALSAQGFSCFRYDRRGVGDSSGADPGYRGAAPDLVAAAAAFRDAVPIARTIGFGLCDGATLLALHGDEAGLDGLILANPWLVESDGDAGGTPPAAAVRARYKERLLSLEGWKKILTGSVDWRKLLQGVRKIAHEDRGLAGEVAAALRRHRLPASLILAAGDATAIAAADAVRRPAFRGIGLARQEIATDSHTFARPGDQAALEAAVLRDVLRYAG
jgi:exosortase A-associated hydrolase 1